MKKGFTHFILNTLFHHNIC